MELAVLRPAAASARFARERARLLAWLEARRADAALLALAAALVILTAARLPAAFESGNALNHVSGAWMTLADDLSRGTFYRPLLAPELGFGGTRFFPLAFVLHAGLLRLGVPLLAAGYALSTVAGALLLAASFLLLRRLGLRVLVEEREVADGDLEDLEALGRARDRVVEQHLIVATLAT